MQAETGDKIMAIIKWTPFPFVESFDELEKSFDGWPSMSNSFTPAIDVYEDKNDVVVEAPLVGIDPEKVDISVEDGVLTMKGESEKKSEVDDKNYYRKEVRRGSFFRSVSLPAKVDADGAEASYAQGILTVRIPKAAEAKPKSIKVSIGNK